MPQDKLLQNIIGMQLSAQTIKEKMTEEKKKKKKKKKKKMTTRKNNI